MERPKALIIGPDFYNFNTAAAVAFEKLGWQTLTATYGTPVDPYCFVAKVGYKLAGDKRRFAASNRIARQSHYCRIFDEYAPDVVFVLN